MSNQRAVQGLQLAEVGEDITRIRQMLMELVAARRDESLSRQAFLVATSLLIRALKEWNRNLLTVQKTLAHAQKTFSGKTVRRTTSTTALQTDPNH